MSDATAAALWGDVLGLVIRLHDREADAELIAQLRALEAPLVFAAILDGREDAATADAFGAALAQLGTPPGSDELDEMAADFADLYLTHGYRIAATGSVWMTDDHLERQEPMFEVRDWYDHYGMKVPDWRIRSDDHLVHELQFLHHLLKIGTPDTLGDAAQFLDLHVMGWLPDFCALGAVRARTPFHATAVAVTRPLLESLRDWLTETTGVQPDIRANGYARALDTAARQAALPEIERPFMPGLAPSW